MREELLNCNCKEKSDDFGEVVINDLIVPINEFKSAKVRKNCYYFVGVFYHGEEVFATVPREPFYEKGFVLFEDKFVFSHLERDFEISVRVFYLKVKRRARCCFMVSCEIRRGFKFAAGKLKSVYQLTSVLFYFSIRNFSLNIFSKLVFC